MSSPVEHRSRVATSSLLPYVVPVLALFAGASVDVPARADSIAHDPTRFQSFSLARPVTAGAATHFVLPRAPAVSARTRIAEGISEAPVVTRRGSLVLALGTPSVAEYDGQGRQRWVARLGSTPAVTSPVVLGDGTVLALTESSELIGFTATGAPAFRRPFGAGNLDTSVARIAPLGDGGLLIASARRVVRLDASLSTRYTLRFEADIRAVLPSSQALATAIVVSNSGAVFRVGPDGAVEKWPNLGGKVDAVVRATESRILAVVDGHRLVELELATRAVITRWSEPDLALSSTLASNVLGEVAVLTTTDWLLVFGADGRERLRVALPASSAAPGPHARGAQLLLDARGNALVARPTADWVSVQADGSSSRIENSACADPLEPQLVADGTVVATCRSGLVLRIEELPAR
jgi:outer membrane protein assembly factor BamB